MASATVYSGASETTVRKLRTLLGELMESAGESDGRPAICRRINDTRRRQQEQWKADHPGERDNPYTQESVARRVGVTLGAYGAWERTREPELFRLRQIATALGLDEDYFSPTGDLASATARVEAEADQLAEIRGELRELLPVLRALVQEQALPRSR